MGFRIFGFLTLYFVIAVAAYLLVTEPVADSTEDIYRQLDQSIRDLEASIEANARMIAEISEALRAMGEQP